MARVKANLKNSALRALRSAGAYSLAANSEARRGKLLILCYHGIALRDEDEWAGHLFITAEQFRNRLACLRAMQANILPLTEAVARLKAGTLPPRSVVLTFDDGFYDFHHHAVPILQEFDAPCTLYLTTYYSEHQWPIANLMLAYLLWKGGKTSVAFPEFGIPQEIAIADWDGQVEAVRLISKWFEENDITTAGKDATCRQIASYFGIDYDDLLRSRILQLVTPKEAAAVAEAGIDLQLHTHRHRTPRDRDLFHREIEDNRTRIEAITGKRPVHFCYPSGVYADEFLLWLTECGVETATTCERGFARADSPSLLLPRLLDDSNMDIIQFEGYVSGLLG